MKIKLKTKSSAKKRFQLKGNKIKRNHSHTTHLAFNKSNKRKRHLRKSVLGFDKIETKIVKKMLNNK